MILFSLGKVLPAWSAARLAVALLATLLLAQSGNPAAFAANGAAQCRALRGPDWMECHFRLGMRAAAARRWRVAIVHFRAMLERKPALARPRLELARAYFMVGNDAQAERHFRYALGGGLPVAVQHTVSRYLEAIKRRKRWSFSVDFSITPQTNANRATKARTVIIGGVPWTLTPDSRKKSGLNIDFKGDFLYRPFLSDNLRGHLRLTPQFSATTEKNSLSSIGDLSLADSSITFAGEAGLVFLADRQEISTGLSGGRTWYHKKGYRYDIGWWLRGYRELDDLTRVSANLEISRLHFDDSIERKGWDVTFQPGLRRQVSSSLALSFSPSILWHKVKAKDRSYLAAGATLGGDVILPYNFSFYLGCTLTRTRYSAVDDIFGKRRKDWSLRARSRLTWARWTAFDLAPYVEYSFERRDSTLKLHDYSNHAVMIGLTKTF